MAVSIYGGFRDGVDYVIKDSETMLHAVKSIIQEAGVPNEYIVRTQNQAAVPIILRRALRRMEKLEHAGRNISPEEYRREVLAIRRDIKAALALTDETEKGLVVEGIRRDVRLRLPNLPPDVLFRDAPLAIRPNDFDVTDAEFNLEQPQVGGALAPKKTRRLKRPEPHFRVVQSTGRLRLRQD